MDPETLWRQAQAEHAPQSAHGDDDDWEVDEDLLRMAPCAQDVVNEIDNHSGWTIHRSDRERLGHTADLPVGREFGGLNEMSQRGEPAAIRGPGSLSAASPPADPNRERGVLRFPPLGRSSFLLKNEAGAVRWVTLSESEEKGSVVGKEDDSEGESDRQERRRRGNDRYHTQRLGILGGADLQEMLKEVYEAQVAEREKKARQQQQWQQNVASNEMENMHLASPVPTSCPLPHDDATDDALWVTKYAPLAFRDVLSDEAINLQLVQWMKSWDAFVFQARDATAIPQGQPGGASAGLVPSVVEVAPPEERMAVLVGPPGTGKTTLAHVLAAHCGYEAIEINASVERTSSRLESMITVAVSAGRAGATSRIPRGPRPAEVGESAASLMDHLLRPKCLIIDEMDGIASNVAEYLLKQDIRRPVFCLCNDWYVPSLRPLRMRCHHVFHFPPIRPQRLLSRLEDIAKREMMSVDHAALAELIQNSNGDVRNCLNTLQFLHRMSRSTGGSTQPGAALRQQVTLDMIRGVHGKDTKLSAWQCWDLLLRKMDRTKAVQRLKKECNMDYDAMMAAAAAATAQMHAEKTGNIAQMGQQARLADAVTFPSVVPGFRVDPGFCFLSQTLPHCVDDGSLVLNGIHANYLQNAYVDYSFSRTSAAAGSLSHQDVLSSAAFTRTPALISFSQVYELVTALTCYANCSTTTRTGGHFAFPREFTYLSQEQGRSAHTAHCFREGCAVELRPFLPSDENLSLDVCPLLLRCLFNASLRTPVLPVASLAALPKADEACVRASAARHVEYGLDYRCAKTSPDERVQSSTALIESDDLKWCLTPAIEQLGLVLRTPRSATHTRGGHGHQKHYGERGAHSRWPRGGVSSAGDLDGTRSTPSPVCSVLLQAMKGELMQLLVSEIQRLQILKRAATLKGNVRASEKGLHDANNGVAVKRPRGNEGVPADDNPVKLRAVEPSSGAASMVGEPAVAAAASAASPAPVRRDFFGRIIPTNVGVVSGARVCGKSRTALATAPRKKLTVSYVFHDGFTNAVQMPAALKDF